MNLTRSEALDRVRRVGEVRELVVNLMKICLEEARDSLEFSKDSMEDLYRAQGRAELARMIIEAISRN